MYKESVEIYSDQSNAAVMRHPGRKFPGILVQGDTVHGLFEDADAVYKAALGASDEEGLARLAGLRDRLHSLLIHYKNVLSDHDIPLPFSEEPAR